VDRGREGGEGGEAAETEGIWRDSEEEAEAGCEVIRGRETFVGKGLAVVICGEPR